MPNRLTRPILAVSTLVLLIRMVSPQPLGADTRIEDRIDQLAAELEDDVIAWRHDIHQHPELSNQEFRTANLVAKHIENLGMEVQTKVAETGVVGILKGGSQGPVIALRADMDALPVAEQTGLPYASKVVVDYNGTKVGVMHACGHDAHIAILMGTAQILATVRKELPGTVKFIFQPAEEGAWPAPSWGAKQMIEEGVLENPRPDAIIGLHVWATNRTGTIGVRSGPTMASSDFLRITVTGQQTHAAAPWLGIDPITVASQIILGLQTVASRQVNILGTPSVISIGTIRGGDRNNIIPDEVVMTGTIRTFDPEIRADIHDRITRTAEAIAAAAGATAVVYIGADTGYATTTNDPELTRAMIPVLARVAGEENVFENPLITGAEDFSFYQQQIPGLFFFLGATPDDENLQSAASNHSPLFTVDDAALITGTRALSYLAVEFLNSQGAR